MLGASRFARRARAHIDVCVGPRAGGAFTFSRERSVNENSVPAPCVLAT